MGKKLNSDEMMTAILSYLGILVLIPLLAIEKKKRTPFIKFHLEQGINLLILSVIIFIAGGILTFITLGLFGIIMILVWLALLIVVIVALVKAVSGEKWKIPLIGDIKMVKL